MLNFILPNEQHRDDVLSFYDEIKENGGACKAAEHLYKSCGFKFVEAKEMFYEDTGWTEYKMFELNL